MSQAAVTSPLHPVSVVQRDWTHDDLEGVKYVALALMTLDHLLIALPDPWAHLGYLAGRPCVALFSFVVLSRLAAGPVSRVRRMLVRLVVWAGVAQPVYWLLTRHMGLRLDVLFTLAAGVAMIWALRTDRRWLAGVIGLAALAAWPWLDGGGLAPLALAGGWALAWRNRPWSALAVVVGASLIHNAAAMDGWWPALLGVLSAPVLVLAARRAGRLPRLPRLPGWLFYAYYPAHLGLILLVFGPY